MSQRKQDEWARREKDILASATALFSGDDWATVTMDQIAIRSQVSKGTLYNHFASKDEIYAHLLVGFSEEVLMRLAEVDPAASPPERMGAMLAVLWDAYRSHPQYRRISYYCEREDFRAELGAASRGRLEALDQRFLSPAQEVIAQGVAAGCFRNAPMAELLMGLQMVLAGMSRLLWTAPADAAADDPRFGAVCDFVLTGLGVSGTPPRATPS